tara:strand:- start:6395 stop:6835 length:441 start_codon:yes stop_codon:yes gene_type:complete
MGIQAVLLAGMAVSSLASAGFTIMQSRQNMAQIRANQAWANYQQNLEKEYEKQRMAQKQLRLMSEQRARTGAKGTQFSGSPLLVIQEDLEEYENELTWLDRINFAKQSARSSEAQGLISQERTKQYASAFEGVTGAASAGFQYSQL